MLKKQAARKARHKGIRKKMSGTTERPRLCVFRSLNHLYAQAIDDLDGKTLCAASTAEKTFVSSVKGPKAQKAEKLGEILGERLKSKGIAKIAFDRAGYQYHGRVKALAEALRKSGIQF